MTRYRTYLLGRGDRIQQVLETEFEDDARALRQAGLLRGEHDAAEVWRGDAIVGRLGEAFSPFAPD